jgi:serine/threonine-protein kinase
MDHDIDDVIDGRYTLIEVVGQGGHGVVYRALDQETGAHVAVKYLRPEFASDPALKARLRREARAMGELAGTSATHVFAFSEAPDGTLYIVMEFLKGSDLETTLRQLEARNQRLPLDEIRELFRPIVDTLDAAHARGIVHRDLKPANIFVLDHDTGVPSSTSPHRGSAPARAGTAARGRVRLLDFGLVKVMQADPLTREGAIPGSPSYIAPEVWKGRPQEIDHRIDIYSLGAVLFRALAGRLPFAGASRVDILLAAARPSVPTCSPRWTRGSRGRSPWPPRSASRTSARFGARWSRTSTTPIDPEASLPPEARSRAEHVPHPTALRRGKRRW